MVKTRKLFISHSWTYTDAYDKLCSLLNGAPYFKYANYSVPKDDPIHNASNARALRAAIKRQMTPCQIVLIMAGKYATYSKWINEEIDIAKRDFNKPLLAITPWGAQQISSVVRNNADLIVKWNTSSIVNGIRALAP